MAAVALRFSYVDTRAGQLHVTEAGEGEALVLLHWVPLSGRMYDDELPVLAAAGYRAIAIDLAGFGRSVKPADFPLGFEQHAELVSDALEALGVEQCALLGAHFSAPIAIELACTGRVALTRLALDGVAHLLPPEAGKAIAARTGTLPGPGLHADGSHRTFLWDQAVTALGIFDPDFEPSPVNVKRVYRLILDYLSTGMPADFGSFAPYPVSKRLAALSIPVAVITAETDPLRAAQDPTLAAVADGTAVVFPGAHPLHDPTRAGVYARALVGFLQAAPHT